jgi:hypothetical protein
MPWRRARSWYLATLGDSLLVFLGAISASFFIDCLGVEKVRCSGPGMRKIACWRAKSRGRILQVAQAPKRGCAKTLVTSRDKQTPITVQGPLEAVLDVVGMRRSPSHAINQQYVKVGLLLLHGVGQRTIASSGRASLKVAAGNSKRRRGKAVSDGLIK